MDPRKKWYDPVYKLATGLDTYPVHHKGAGYLISYDIATYLDTLSSLKKPRLMFLPSEDVAVGFWLQVIEKQIVNLRTTTKPEGCVHPETSHWLVDHYVRPHLFYQRWWSWRAVGNPCFDVPNPSGIGFAPTGIDPEIMQKFAEQRLAEKYLNRAVNVLDQGSFLTMLALGKRNIEHVYVKHSHPKYIQELTKNEEVRENIKTGRLQLFHADIGPVREYGYPSDGIRHRASWANYCGNMTHSRLRFDLTVIAGRFRVLCFLKAVAQTPHDLRGDRGSTFLFLNFKTRPAYRVVMQFAKVVEEIGDLAVLRILRDINDQSLETLTKKHVYEPL